VKISHIVNHKYTFSCMPNESSISNIVTKT
jgi:hypothetical protein